MNVLSLFDGMSCGRIALDRAGVKVDNYFASEIDKYAQIVSQRNYPDIVRLGDVRNWQNWQLPQIDLLIGGSPCQGFSNAGDGLNFEDPRSKLFFTFVDILRALKPKYFLLENVKMKKAWADIITQYMKVPSILINSALVSAQNRERYYWTNIDGVTQPADKGIVLMDILEPDLKQTLSEKAVDYMNRKTSDGRNPRDFGHHSDVRKGKSATITANFAKGVPYNVLILAGMADDIKGHDYNRRIYSPIGKGPALNAGSGGNLEPKVTIIQRGRGFNKGGEMAKNGKTPTLTSSRLEENNHLFLNGETYRKLTVLECERLQTVPDGYTEGVSNSQRYKMLGNGWTIDVIAHILGFMNSGNAPLASVEQLQMFGVDP